MVLILWILIDVLFVGCVGWEMNIFVIWFWRVWFIFVIGFFFKILELILVIVFVKLFFFIEVFIIIILFNVLVFFVIIILIGWLFIIFIFWVIYFI